MNRTVKYLARMEDIEKTTITWTLPKRPTGLQNFQIFDTDVFINNLLVTSASRSGTSY